MVKKEKILVTGSAGFIGFHLCKRILKENFDVIGFDNINNYYSTELKLSRLKILKDYSESSLGKFTFVKGELEKYNDLEKVFKIFQPKIIIHLAAQAGVRYSIENPHSYINSNLVGFANILEICRRNNVYNLIYASSSSVYGGYTNLPFSEKNPVEHPVSLYAATKKSNELMAHSYSHLYGIPSTGIRFFTVYGPWGRPDMAPMIFTKSILNGEKIKIFNNGDMYRDFTYIDDVVENLYLLVKKPAKPNKEFNLSKPVSSSSWAPYQILNLGNSQKIKLIEFINCLEEVLDKKALKEYLPMQDGDVKATLSSSEEIEKITNFKPKTQLKDGLNSFVKWYKNYYSY